MLSYGIELEAVVALEERRKNALGGGEGAGVDKVLFFSCSCFERCY